MCDAERDLWVLNDEGLHRLWWLSRQARRQWIRENRGLIDEVVGNISAGRNQAHYLVYGA